MELPDVTIDVPITADQATLLLEEMGQMAATTHTLALGTNTMPGQWRVFAVRADYIGGDRHHFASLEWIGPVK